LPTLQASRAQVAIQPGPFRDPLAGY
jgi:hypothetical protein